MMHPKGPGAALHLLGGVCTATPACRLCETESAEVFVAHLARGDPASMLFAASVLVPALLAGLGLVSYFLPKADPAIGDAPYAPPETLA